MERAPKRLKPSISAGSSRIIGASWIESYADRPKPTFSGIPRRLEQSLGIDNPWAHTRFLKALARNLTNSCARQLALQLGNQLRYWLTRRSDCNMTAVFEHPLPMGDGVTVHGSPAPASSAVDGRNEVGANAPFDFHGLRIPSSFLDGFDAFFFLGGFAFGLRASLFDRCCPSAIDAASRSATFQFPPIGCGAGVEVSLDPLE